MILRLSHFFNTFAGDFDWARVGVNNKKPAGVDCDVIMIAPTLTNRELKDALVEGAKHAEGFLTEYRAAPDPRRAALLPPDDEVAGDDEGEELGCDEYSQSQLINLLIIACACQRSTRQIHADTSYTKLVA